MDHQRAAREVRRDLDGGHPLAERSEHLLERGDVLGTGLDAHLTSAAGLLQRVGGERGDARGLHGDGLAHETLGEEHRELDGAIELFFRPALGSGAHGDHLRSDARDLLLARLPRHLLGDRRRAARGLGDDGVGQRPRVGHQLGRDDMRVDDDARDAPAGAGRVRLHPRAGLRLRSRARARLRARVRLDDPRALHAHRRVTSATATTTS